MVPKTVEKCGICCENDAKYKCPKCGLRYCSLACYKDKSRHKDPVDPTDDKQKEEQKQNEDTTRSTERPQLVSSEWRKVYSETPEIQDLLKYNTVKFHLSKVHRILSSEVADPNESNMNSEMKKQLAVDYLNTLRYGGIHYNEAIEEFCQISLSKLNGESNLDS